MIRAGLRRAEDASRLTLLLGLKLAPACEQLQKPRQRQLRGDCGSVRCVPAARRDLGRGDIFIFEEFERLLGRARGSSAKPASGMTALFAHLRLFVAASS